jgi:hypothetical protein
LGWRGAMFDGEIEFAARATQVQIGVAPAWNSEEPRSACPARIRPADLRA